MTRSEILSALSALKSELLQTFKAEIKGLFGSIARGDGTADSDIDILVEFKDGATLFDLSALGNFLEEKLGRNVDVVSTRALREELKERVQKDLVPV